MRIELFDDDGVEVFFSAIEVYLENEQFLAGAYKVGGPPGMLGGEFVKDENGKTQLFRVEQYAIDAAKKVYEEKK